jgi:hypothetical protein
MEIIINIDMRVRNARENCGTKGKIQMRIGIGI